MELDFETVKALSSPTRIEILNEAMAKERTPTEISDSIGRSKSTVSSHLKQLEDAGLVSKDSEEGRRRVIYEATDKSQDIIEGKSRKVKFSILSTASNMWIGAGLLLGALAEKQRDAQDAAGTMGTMGVESAAQSTASQPPVAEAFLFVGLGFLSISVFGIVYGLLVSKLG